ncbi:MAG: hypothetical protein GF408_03495 [Candidatus Omnitrophica bacterium]|nr:hypothetical protein [Candidatus Omnitrophota bacterium]
MQRKESGVGIKTFSKTVRAVSVAVIVCFMSVNLFADIPYRQAVNCVEATLAPPSVMNNIVPENMSRIDMEAQVLYLMEQFPGVLEAAPEENRDFMCQKAEDTVKIFFSLAVKESVKRDSATDQMNAHYIPVMLNGELGYVRVLKDNGRIIYSETYSIERFFRAHEGHRILRLISKDIDAMKADSGKSYILMNDDDGFNMAREFLEVLGAVNLAEKLLDAMRSRKIIFSEKLKTPLPEGYIAAGGQTPEERAAGMLEAFISEAHGDFADFSSAFRQFNVKWNEKQERDIVLEDLVQGPEESKLALMEAVRDMEAEVNRAGNEGYETPPHLLDLYGDNIHFIDFADKAYTLMRKEVLDVDIRDCSSTIDDIYRIFRSVAEHEAEHHNRAIEEGAEGKKIDPADIPGYDPDSISICKLSNCPLPTDLVSEYGEIKINENFVKLVHVMGKRGLKGNFGKIYEYISEEERGFPSMGEMYSSIIYALAIHTIRGHFPVSSSGKAIFVPDESLAQPERGRKYLYLNSLATLFYWIVLVERHCYPWARAYVFIKRYPEIFSGLSPEERGKLPFHLRKISERYLKDLTLPSHPKVVRTDETRQSVLNILRKNPGWVSNEGNGPQRPDGAGNEGGLKFNPMAYSHVMLRIKGVEEHDYRPVVAKLRAVFQRVGRHERDRHNDLYAKGFANVRLILNACERKAEAGEADDPVGALEELPEEMAARLEGAGLRTVKDVLDAGAGSVEKQGLSEDEYKDKLRRARKKFLLNIPGIGYGKQAPTDEYYDPLLDPRIEIKKLSEAILPTDITTNLLKDGKILINENFMKLLCSLYLSAGMDAEGKEIRKLAETIMYSLAIHTIKGHFPINEWGFPEYNRDEETAQGERGGNNLYRNILGMAYYWLALVEQDLYPGGRLEEFMRDNPSVFRRLSEKEKESLVDDFNKLYFATEDIFRIRGESILPTNETKKSVEKIFSDYPDSVSNEGQGPGSGESVNGTELAAVFYAVNSAPAEGLVPPVEISQLSGVTSEVRLSWYIDLLKDLGIVKGNRRDGYRSIMLNSVQARKIAGILEGSGPADIEGIKSRKAEIFKITRTKWAESFLDLCGLRESTSGANVNGKKLVIGIETGWMPSEQEKPLMELVRSLEDLNDTGSVRIVRGRGPDLAEELKNAVREEEVSLESVVVLAHHRTISDSSFDDMRAGSDEETDKAFMAGVDPTYLKGDSYIILMQMLSAAIGMATGKDDFADLQFMSMIQLNRRTVIFIPKAVPMDLEDIEEIYQTQRKIIRSA